MTFAMQMSVNTDNSASESETIESSEEVDLNKEHVYKPHKRQCDPAESAEPKVCILASNTNLGFVNLVNTLY